MKIRKSELKDLGPTVTISRTMKRELKRNLEQLKIVLKDDSDFANLLVEKTLLLGEGVYANEIDHLVREKYLSGPITTPNNVSICRQVSGITYDLGEIIYGDKLTRKKLFSLPVEEQDNAFLQLREEAELEINNIFFSSENQNYSIMGETSDMYE